MHGGDESGAAAPGTKTRRLFADFWALRIGGALPMFFLEIAGRLMERRGRGRKFRCIAGLDGNFRSGRNQTAAAGFDAIWKNRTRNVR
ncbi:hypothetical protein Zmor_019921 [Zophobas morio]|uniref:Uncharacterized protein n=1 Tax=Zophobas morio TaxID=2755281 RepID=A0AA38I1R3_9CUCU|nr:hypothetical protein Zmor_019921 [Zophobas morio]